MIRRPPRSTQSRSSAASDVYKRQPHGPERACSETVRGHHADHDRHREPRHGARHPHRRTAGDWWHVDNLSLIHISEPTRLGMISYAVFCLKKKKKHDINV